MIEKDKTEREEKHRHLFEKTEYVFVRVKDNEHCVNMVRIHKTHEIMWNGGKTAILKMTKGMYECHRNWLIKHPFLSCLTEIQLINPLNKIRR